MDTSKSSSGAVPGRIKNDILALLQNRPIQMFSDIARALPHYSWHALFTALHQLASQNRVELVRHRWDYEIFLASVYSANRKPCGTVVSHVATRMTETMLQKSR